MQGRRGAEDDEVLGERGVREHAVRHDLGIVVPGLPEDHGVVHVLQVVRGLVAIDRLELVAAGLVDDVAVRVARGVQVLDVLGERVVVVLDLRADVSEVHDVAAGDFHGLRVLEDLGVVVALLELDDESGREGRLVGQEHQDPVPVDGTVQLEDRIAHILLVVLFVVGDLHLEELIPEGVLLGRGDGVAAQALAHGHRQDAEDVLELEGVAVVARRQDLLAGRGELAVEEAVLEVVRQRRRIGGVQGAGAVLPLVGIEAVHLDGGRLAVAGDVPGAEGHGHLVLGVFAVDDDLVAGLPGGLDGSGHFPALPDGEVGKDEGERAGFGLGSFGFGRNRNRLLVAGEERKKDCAKDRYSFNRFHDFSRLMVL